METSSPSTPQFVRDLMTVGVATCPPETPAVDIARLMLEKGLEAVVVLDESGHAVGVVSQEALVRAYSREDARQLTAAQVMSEDVPQVPPDLPLSAVAQIMRDQSVRAVFLMHHAGGIEYPAAVLTYQHLLRHLAARDASELKDLGIQASRQTPLEAFIQRREAARKANLKR